MRDLTYANGTLRTWERLAVAFSRLLPDPEQAGWDGEIRISEATDWDEPGTPRHGLDYWFLALAVKPTRFTARDYASFDARKYCETLGFEMLGGSEDDDGCIVYDVEPGWRPKGFREKIREANERRPFGD